MIQRFRLGVVAAVVVACSSDITSARVPRQTLGPTSHSSGPGLVEATPLSITIFPNEIVGDGTNTTTARVNVDSIVSCCDRFVQVTTNNPAVLPFLSSGATVSAGTSFAAVQIDPTAVTQRTVVTIFVTGNGATISADVILDPPGTTIQPTLSAFTVNPSSVSAGTVATGTITIPSAAPAGGVLVNLSSRQPGSADVPSSVTVPQGATRVSFPVTTFIGFPNSTTCVRLAATTAISFAEGDICVVTGGTTPVMTPLTAPTMLTPTADQRFTRGATITFDWSDVTGAASYELQVDDRDTFAAPLLRDERPTESQLAVSGLPTTRMFWRVRGISSSGIAGPWSTVRRFEIK
jgi:hypothetical protein